MKTLSTEHRRQLERTVVNARDVAETGARAALEALAVDRRDPFDHMSDEQRALRRPLRAHARHLGDKTDGRSGTHGIDHLTHECAYEHWHAMLFARFLAENNLLIEPELGVPVTLDECEELAKDEGTDRWTLASRFAQRMLPQVFRPDHPVFQVRLARESRVQLEELVEGLPTETFKASDALGWVYQFWQARKKDEVNRSEAKIGADELPAVTQLFTEPYMVQFLLHNSLGAWWESRHPDQPCPTDLTYLRHAKEGQPAAGTFDGWPDDLSEFRLLDPCCGSGHFLVTSLLMLVPMRMRLEGLDASTAVSAVLHDNLHGLEIDQRCVAIAAFALALEAWRYPDAGGFRRLPRFNLAWCGQPVAARKEEWLALAGGDPQVEAGMAALHDAFRDAPTLGSLIDPARSAPEDMLTARFDQLRPLLEQALERHGRNPEDKETAIAALGMAEAGDMLTTRFHLVATNVPYLGREKQSPLLRIFCEERFSRSKQDLATVFLERILRLCVHDGTTLLVVPRYWLFLTRYRNLRRRLLAERAWHMLATLGPRAFESIGGEVVNVCLLIIGASRSQIGDAFSWIDATNGVTPESKAMRLQDEPIRTLSQSAQTANPDSVIGYEADADTVLLGRVAYAHQGLATSDNAQFVFNFWELPQLANGWEPFQFAPSSTAPISGCSHALLWEDGRGRYARHADALRHEGRLGGWKSGHAAWGKRGVAINRMGDLPASLYLGTKFDCNVAVVVPNDDVELAPIWAYCSSPEYGERVRKLNQKPSVTNATLTKVPYDAARWGKSQINGTDGSPAMETNDPTQWAFHGNPRYTTHPLQVAVARLLGYRWPMQTGLGIEVADRARQCILEGATLDALATEDGIVCVPAVRGHGPAEQKLVQLLERAWGPDWREDRLASLLTEVGSRSLDDWLRNAFFEQHCQLFHHRPFVWHVWDGRKNDGFHALVNYHRLTAPDGAGRRTMESLTYSYLGEWLARRQDDVKRGVNAADARLAAALELQQRLVAILEGEPPFDIFVRWKPIQDQPIGWAPDLNDGVRLNIRPFMADDLPSGLRGAGVLRAKPNIGWRKDKGREPMRCMPDYPWFWVDGEFTGDRVNDAHFTANEKMR